MTAAAAIARRASSCAASSTRRRSRSPRSSHARSAPTSGSSAGAPGASRTTASAQGARQGDRGRRRRGRRGDRRERGDRLRAHARRPSRAGARTAPTIGTPPSGAFTQVAAGFTHGCALDKKGAVTCWGTGDWAAPKGGFAKPASISGATHLATGDRHACVVTKDKKVQCWGMNDAGQLGTKPDTELHKAPVTVPGVAGAVRLVAGEAAMCALLADGSARCWGANAEGELGLGKKSSEERREQGRVRLGHRGHVPRDGARLRAHQEQEHPLLGRERRRSARRRHEGKEARARTRRVVTSRAGQRSSSRVRSRHGQLRQRRQRAHDRVGRLRPGDHLARRTSSGPSARRTSRACWSRRPRERRWAWSR